MSSLVSRPGYKATTSLHKTQLAGSYLSSRNPAGRDLGVARAWVWVRRSEDVHVHKLISNVCCNMVNLPHAILAILESLLAMHVLSSSVAAVI